ncbi:MAG: B12-binding domain-containing radical SAM protein [Chloroflexi bacterium]|nr:B12-binding domain-containing radical SAM protein [Chloroflexota bacterium]
MFNRILLLQPPSSSYLGAIRPPAGLGYLSQALEENHIEHQVLDMRERTSLSALTKRIRSFQPDLIGVSMVSLEYKRTYALIQHIKEYCPHASIVVGGAHLSAYGETVLEECRAIDFGIVQEGERTLVQLCRGESSLAEIPGLLYRRDGAVLSGPKAELVWNLDESSFPRYHHFDLRDYAKEIPLITSRGCPYRCIFCINSSIKTRNFRPRSAANVVDEIEYWYSHGIKKFVVDDDCFSLQEKRVQAICDEIKRRELKGLFIRLSNGIRADRSNREMLARLKEIGVREVGFGADGGNNRVLTQIAHKGETIEVIEQAVRDAIDLGIEVRLFIVIGYPGETMSDIEDSFALAQRYPLILLHLNNPIPYPGTELFEIVRKNNYFLRPPEDYLNNCTDNDDEPVFATPELPADVRRRFLKRARAIERRVWQRATERMLGNVPVIRTIAGMFFVTQLGHWLFFKNIFTRSLIDRIWYRRMVNE